MGLSAHPVKDATSLFSAPCATPEKGPYFADMPTPLQRDFKADPERGPGVAERYTRAGLRVVPIDPNSKAAARKGFGKRDATFSTPPEDFKESELVAILMGPCPIGDFAEGRWISGFDFDGDFDRYALEKRVGLLPETLSSKGGRHLYYWLPRELPGRDDIRQCNDLFRTKKKRSGAVDWRPCAGGYFLERGDWDGPFDLTRVADLPRHAWDLLQKERTKRAGPPAPPCQIPMGYAQRCVLPEAQQMALADQLATIWPEPGAGGGHDLALAMGGILADAWISEDEAVAFCCRIWDGAGAPYQIDEVLTSMILRRTNAPRPVFGWPKLREILLEHNHPEDVKRVLFNFARRMPGLSPPEFLHARASGKVA